jgi:tetratricopeptide (TPR) repeat protein
MRLAHELALSFSLLLGAACASPGSAPPAAPEGPHLTVIRARTEAPSFGPSKFEPQLASAQEAAEGGRFDEANQILDAIIAEYRALPRGGVVYTVGGPAEMLTALMEASLGAEASGSATGETIAAVPLDPGFPRAFGLRAFIQVERREYAAALETLGEHERIVRSDPTPTNERGFVLLVLKRPAEAVAAYREGLEKARQFEGSEKIQAISLRGIGIALIDLGELDEAKASLLESLQLDPGNYIANHELEYIEKLAAQRR